VAKLDFRKLKTHSIRKRHNLAEQKRFGGVPPANCSAARLLESLPDTGAASALRAVAEAIAAARRRKRPVIAALGAHVIKCGLGPTLIDLMKRGFLTGLAVNGACAIHDYELSLIGATSEDVAEGLEDGSFGMGRETAAAFAEAARASGEGAGLGAALGALILKARNRHARLSLLAQAAKLGVPVTVHVAVGTDIVHMHPGVSGAATGEATMLDFRTLCGLVADLEGGVWLNVGSAVVMPEVFLKALAVARNIKGAPKKFTAANFDMLRHYRPQRNVLERPGGAAYNITGHHEILLPLLRLAVLNAGGTRGRRTSR
jgi:hypothetical protein